MVKPPPPLGGSLSKAAAAGMQAIQPPFDRSNTLWARRFDWLYTVPFMWSPPTPEPAVMLSQRLLLPGPLSHPTTIVPLPEHAHPQQLTPVWPRNRRVSQHVVCCT